MTDDVAYRRMQAPSNPFGDGMAGQQIADRLGSALCGEDSSCDQPEGQVNVVA